MANMGIIRGSIALVLAVILTVTVVVPTIKDANTSGFSTAELSVFGLTSLIAIFGLVNLVAGVYGL